MNVLIVVLAGVLLTACGSQTAPGEARGHRTQPSDGCPLAPDDLITTTSLNWKLSEKKDDHPLESVKATVCLYTAADAPQDGSDPLVMRVDIVTGADAATVRRDFTETCTEYGGKVRASTDDAAVCDRDGAIVEGIVTGADRLVSVYLVNADKATAAELTPSFDEILAAVT